MSKAEISKRYGEGKISFARYHLLLLPHYEK